MLAAAGWLQDAACVNLAAARGVAVREFTEERDVVDVLRDEGVRFSPTGAAWDDQRLRQLDLERLISGPTQPAGM